MNIFENAPEFITRDNRRLRSEFVTTFESIANRLEAQLPTEIIQGKTVLDLGSCIGAAGYYSLINGASHYTGIELQQFYAKTSEELLQTYCSVDHFKIICQDLLLFLDECILRNIKFDVTLAAGILYEFMDPISFLQKICRVTNETVVIDTKWIQSGRNGIGILAMRPNEAMVRGISSDTHSIVRGIGSMMCINAIDMVMSTEHYHRTGIILPKYITDTEDPYNIEYTHPSGQIGPKKIIAQYKKTENFVMTLNDILIKEEANDNF